MTETMTDTPSNPSYAKTMGRHAGLAGRLAANGEPEKALARAKDAAGQRELLHPGAWHLWDQASDELFERAVILLTAEEKSLLQGARDDCQHGTNIVMAFAGSERKLRALAGAGVDLNAPCPYAGQRARDGAESKISPAMRFCFDGDILALECLSRAGALPPEALSAAEAAECPSASSDPRSSLHALALSSLTSYQVAQERLDATVAWLASGVSVSLRNKKGLDAFKVAMAHSQGGLCEALIKAGADLNLKDGNGLDAFEHLAKLLRDDRSCRPDQARERQEMARALAPLMGAWRELRAISHAIGSGAPEPAPRRPAL